MVPRFYAPLIVTDGEGALPVDEAEHAVRVLRLRRGDEIRVFDGRGAERVARVTAVSGKRVTVAAHDPVEPAAEPRVAITVAQAVLKGDKMDDLVRDAAMLGASAIQPIVSARSELTRAALERGRKIDRWQRVALASVKQCGRAVLPEVRPAVSFDDYVRTCIDDARLVLVEPRTDSGKPPITIHELARRRVPGRAAILIGPEGGWSTGEVGACIAAGWVPVTLGPRTLRADAVPVVALALLLFVWDGQ